MLYDTGDSTSFTIALSCVCVCAGFHLSGVVIEADNPLFSLSDRAFKVSICFDRLYSQLILLFNYKHCVLYICSLLLHFLINVLENSYCAMSKHIQEMIAEC